MQTAVYRRMPPASAYERNATYIQAAYDGVQPVYSRLQSVDALHSGVDADNDTVIQRSRPHLWMQDGMQASYIFSGAQALVY